MKSVPRQAELALALWPGVASGGEKRLVKSHGFINLGPPVERLEQGYRFLFSVVYFSKGTLPKKGKMALLGDLELLVDELGGDSGIHI